MIRKDQKGITLIALVVTIIILIILAGISINLLFGDNGIIKKAQDAGSKYKDAENQEGRFLSDIDFLIDDYLGVTSSLTIEQARSTGMYNKKSNSKYTDETRPTNNEVTIPAGFRITEDTDKIDQGVVIEDKDENQWVWIPVDNPEELYEVLETPLELGQNTGVYTTIQSKSEIIPGRTRINVGYATSGLREPDLASYYDNNARLPDAGFNSTAEKTATVLFAEEMVNSYYNMIQSIKKYGGFYIGRFELSGSLENPTMGRGQAVLAFDNWFKLYNACTKFSTSTATSKMIWGCLWDEVCLFISERGDVNDRVDINNSSSYGNYTLGLRRSGFSDAWKVRNIYDLAGNAWEWTQEAAGHTGRSANGGGNAVNGENWSVNSRNNILVYGDGGSLSSRPVLYVNP